MWTQPQKQTPPQQEQQTNAIVVKNEQPKQLPNKKELISIILGEDS
jgi:hypothetical protein